MIPPLSIGWFALVLTVVLALPGGVVGSAFADLTARKTSPKRSLTEALEDAKAATAWTLPRRKPRAPRASSDKDDAGLLVLIGLAIVWVIGTYTRYIDIIANALMLVAVFVFLCTITTFALFYFKRYFDGSSIAWRLILSFLLVLAGALSTAWLRQPPLHGDAIAAGTKLTSQDNVWAILALPPAQLYQIGFQFIGALFTLIMLVTFIGLSLGSMFGIQVAENARPALLWEAAFWCNRWDVSGLTWTVAVVLGAVATLFAGGVAYDWIHAAFVWATGLVTNQP